MEEVMQIQMENWAALIKQRIDSGLTVKEWCTQNHVSEAAYYYRLRQLRRKALENINQQPSAVQFEKVPVPMVANSADLALRIHCGASVIEVGNHVSVEILSFLKDVILHAF